MLNCGKCGASVGETAIFCSMCGVRLGESDSSGTSRKPGIRNQAASALARASGLSDSPTVTRAGWIIRGAFVVAGLLLLGGAYLFYRSQNSGGGNQALNLIAPMDKVNQLVSAGQRSFDQGDLTAAKASFEEAEKLGPSNTGVILKLAYAYNASGEVDNALQRFSRVIELDPRNVEARYQRADLLLNRGNWKEAYEDLEYLIANTPNSEQAGRARQILNQFTAQRPPDGVGRSGRRGKRGIQLPEVDQRPPRLAVALPKLATDSPASPLAGAFEDSVTGDTLAKIHKDKGQRYLNAKQFAAAITELQAARRFNPDDPDIYYYLGSSHDGLKQYPLARKYYELCDSGVYVAVARNAAKTARKNEQDEIRKQSRKGQ